MGVYSDTYGYLLCPVLLQLIPEDIALAYTCNSDQNGEWKVPELINFLQNEVQSRERALQLTRPGNKTKNKGTFCQVIDLSVQHQDPLVKENLKVGVYPQLLQLHTASIAPQTWVYCDSPNHNPEHCPDSSVPARQEKLRKLGGCYMCLGPKQWNSVELKVFALNVFADISSHCVTKIKFLKGVVQRLLYPLCPAQQNQRLIHRISCCSRQWEHGQKVQ